MSSADIPSKHFWTQTIVPDLGLNCLHSDGIPGRMFRKVHFYKNQQTGKITH